MIDRYQERRSAGVAATIRTTVVGTPIARIRRSARDGRGASSSIVIARQFASSRAGSIWSEVFTRVPPGAFGALASVGS